jgi:hypothetical protein
MNNEAVSFVEQYPIESWSPNTYPQPKLDNGSWQCGGCRVWYAPWVRQCYCQQYYKWPPVPVNSISFNTVNQSYNKETDEEFVTRCLGLKTTEGYNG